MLCSNYETFPPFSAQRRSVSCTLKACELQDLRTFFGSNVRLGKQRVMVEVSGRASTASRHLASFCFFGVCVRQRYDFWPILQRTAYLIRYLCLSTRMSTPLTPPAPKSQGHDIALPTVRWPIHGSSQVIYMLDDGVLECINKKHSLSVSALALSRLVIGIRTFSGSKCSGRASSSLVEVSGQAPPRTLAAPPTHPHGRIQAGA